MFRSWILCTMFRSWRAGRLKPEDPSLSSEKACGWFFSAQWHCLRLCECVASDRTAWRELYSLKQVSWWWFFPHVGYSPSSQQCYCVTLSLQVWANTVLNRGGWRSNSWWVECQHCVTQLNSGGWQHISLEELVCGMLMLVWTQRCQCKAQQGRLTVSYCKKLVSWMLTLVSSHNDYLNSGDWGHT